jgi:hypothetical protein
MILIGTMPAVDVNALSARRAIIAYTLGILKIKKKMTVAGCRR